MPVAAPAAGGVGAADFTDRDCDPVRRRAAGARAAAIDVVVRIPRPDRHIPAWLRLLAIRLAGPPPRLVALGMRKRARRRGAPFLPGEGETGLFRRRLCLVRLGR